MRSMPRYVEPSLCRSLGLSARSAAKIDRCSKTSWLPRSSNTIVKGGTAWKTKVERYMVYKAPVLKELLEWAEAQDNEDISNDLVVKACSAKLSEEQAPAVNLQI